MCGIVSLISRRNNGFFTADLELFEQLLVLDTLRGLDSTGVFCVDNNRNIGVMKVASHPYHLFACEDYKKWRGKSVNSGRLLVGHNRKATQGGVNSRNAHPFHENNIVLVHNGTLRGDHKKLADTEVDSHALCHAINEKGAENVLPTIDGAFALMWWDIEKSSLFAIRNDERPLNIVVTDELYVVLSEPWMAQALLSRMSPVRKVLDIVEIPAGELYEFKIGGTFTTKKLELKDYWMEQASLRRGHHHYTPPENNSPKTCGVLTTPTPSTTTNNPSGNAANETSGGAKTALTLVTSNPQGSPNPGTTSEDGVPRITADGHVVCTDYPTGMEVLVKFYEMRLSENKKFYVCRGKTLEPGAAEIDVVCYMQTSLLPPEHAPAAIKYTEQPVLATVHKHTNSTCGRSLWVKGVSIPKLFDVHNGKITMHEWNHVVAYCKCQKCTAPIYDEELRFTSISRRSGNKLVATCADCVQDQLTGEFKDAFNQDRLTTVQTIINEREAALRVPDGGAQTSGQPTLH